MNEQITLLVVHPYSTKAENELSLNKNEMITLLKEDPNSEWCFGENSKKERGWFPSSFAIKKNSSRQKRPIFTVTVVHEFEARTQFELNLKKGQKIPIYEEYRNWMLGMVDGQEGMIPKNHVISGYGKNLVTFSSVCLFTRKGLR